MMLTKTFDYIRVMCAQYWPASLHREEEYCYENGDGFRVTVKEELHYASYIHRRMLLRRGTEQRQVVKIFLLSLFTTVPSRWTTSSRVSIRAGVLRRWVPSAAAR